jgi:hypothetical protein
LWELLVSNLPTVWILVLAVLLYNEGQTQDATGQYIRVRIKNESKFLISKVTILGRTFENIESGETTGYFDTKPFYPSLMVDITLQRRPTFGKYQWYHTVTYPIDNVGETRIVNKSNTIVITVSKGEEKGKIDVDTEIIED